MNTSPDDKPIQEESEPKQRKVLAVDLGLRTGLALFTEPGHLTWYRSLHVKKRADLKRAIWSILQEIDRLDALFLEGDRKLASWWEKAARKQFEMLIHVETLGAERWRASMLLPRQQHSGKQAKQVAMEMATELARESPLCKGASSMRHDTAEAILIGAWGWSQLGWSINTTSTDGQDVTSPGR